MYISYRRSVNDALMKRPKRISRGRELTTAAVVTSVRQDHDQLQSMRLQSI